jgi:hypothetical protein
MDDESGRIADPKEANVIDLQLKKLAEEEMSGLMHDDARKRLRRR